MARLAWNSVGYRIYEAGVDRGVLYIGNLAGLPWSGLISVDETPVSSDIKAYYIDGIKYLQIAQAGEFEASIKAYTYPEEFSQCDGTARIRSGLFFGQQERKPFGFSYRTMVGNDVSGSNAGYKIHLVYNAIATPSPRSATTYNDSVEVSEFTWNIYTKSRPVPGYSPTAHVVIDSRSTHPITLATIEAILYGSESNVPRLLTPEELIAIFDVPIEFSITDNEDDTFTISGPNEIVTDIGLDRFTISHDSVVIIDADSFALNY